MLHTPEYAEGFTPCREVARWRRRFWLSLALNAVLAAAFLPDRCG
jgi:hypothetical protein